MSVGTVVVHNTVWTIMINAIFPLSFQTVIIAQMLSVGGGGLQRDLLVTKRL